MNELTTTGQDALLESLRDLDAGPYQASDLNQYLDFLKGSEHTLDTGLVPYVEALQKKGAWTDRNGQKRVYEPRSIDIKLAAAVYIGNTIMDQYPVEFPAETRIAFEKAKKAAAKACPEVMPGLEDDKWLPWDQVHALINGTKNVKMKLIMAVLSQTACRISEALNIELGNMKYNSTHYHVEIKGKGRKHRRVSIAMPLVTNCLKIFGGKVFLFEHGGKQYSPNSITTRIGDSAERTIGRRISAHAFRHSWATEQQERGTPLSEISRYLGHASISITADIYAHKRIKPADAMLEVPFDIDAPLDPDEDKRIANALHTALKHIQG